MNNYDRTVIFSKVIAKCYWVIDHVLMKYDVICPSNCHSTGYEKNVRCINNTKYHNIQITIDKSQLQSNVILLLLTNKCL